MSPPTPAIILVSPAVELVTQEKGLLALANLLSAGRGSAAGAIHRLNRQMGKLYGPPLKNGMTRTVFTNREVVYKVPCAGARHGGLTLKSCIEANLIESPLNTRPYSLPLASRKLVWHRSGIPIVVMEVLRTDLELDSLPSWSLEESIDGQQVGMRMATGEYVIYDGGCREAPTPDWIDDLLAGFE